MKFHASPMFLATLFALALSFLLTGCDHDFDENTTKSRAEGKPVQLDSEQVSVNWGQLNCGVENELWEGAPPAEPGQPVIYRLTQKGRDLQFSDDVYVNETGYSSPYVQVRGKFYLQLDRVVTINTDTDGSKLIQSQLGVKIPHPCFTTPLPIMGIKKGKFASDVPPTLKYENGEEGWFPTGLVH